MRPLSRFIVLVALALLVSGCFSWLPWVDDKGKDLDKPAELVKFNEEVCAFAD